MSTITSIIQLYAATGERKRALIDLSVFKIVIKCNTNSSCVGFSRNIYSLIKAKIELRGILTCLGGFIRPGG